QLAEEEPHRLATAQSPGRLHALVAAEEHPPEKPADLLVAGARIDVVEVVEAGGVVRDDGPDVLRHVADLRLVAPDYLALVRLHLAQDRAQEGRLAHAVAPDDGDLRALGDE